MLTREGLVGLFDLSDRVAIVTGGSRGIGLAMAQGFAAMGARVVVSSRKGEACERAAGDIVAAGGQALAVPAHAGDPDQLAVVVQRAVDSFGRLDIVVNNAANALALPIGSITVEALAKSHDVNVRGPLFLVQHALPYLTAAPRPAVINTISAGVFTHGAGLAMYTSAKAALLALTRSMAAEFAPHGIRVNALAPGAVDTDMVRNNDPATQERMAQAAPLRRMADPVELVGPALLLASDAGSFVTGQVLVADGGLTVH